MKKCIEFFRKIKNILILLCLCSICTHVNADFPINNEYLKTHQLQSETIKTNSGNYASLLRLFDLNIENITGSKFIIGIDNQTNCHVTVDISNYDYIKNEGSCIAYVKIGEKYYKSIGFRALRMLTLDKTAASTGIFFYFDDNISAQLLVCIFNEFQSNARWIISN